MKKAILIICLIIISGCDKYPFLPDDYSEIFLGNWKWYGTSCPFSGSYQPADSAGYTIKLTFDRHGKYHYFKNDTLLFSSNYQFDFDYSHNGTNHYKLKLEKEDHDFNAFITKFNTTDILVLGEANPDACELYYGRLQ